MVFCIDDEDGQISSVSVSDVLYGFPGSPNLEDICQRIEFTHRSLEGYSRIQDFTHEALLNWESGKFISCLKHKQTGLIVAFVEATRVEKLCDGFKEVYEITCVTATPLKSQGVSTDLTLKLIESIKNSMSETKSVKKIVLIAEILPDNSIIVINLMKRVGMKQSQRYKGICQIYELVIDL